MTNENDRHNPLNCLNCGNTKEQSWCWFCYRCTNAKERAYEECRKAGTNNFVDVILAREKALAAIRKSSESRITKG